jgi:hypothetical protein
VGSLIFFHFQVEKVYICNNTLCEALAHRLPDCVKHMTNKNMESMAMKLVKGIVTALVMGSISFGAFAAKEIQKDEVAKMNLTKVGSITTSRTTSPMDAKKDLSKKADKLGGKYFVVIAGEKNEKSVHANADVYK